MELQRRGGRLRKLYFGEKTALADSLDVANENRREMVKKGQLLGFQLLSN